MAKLNSIGVKASEIDEIFTEAIRRIAERKDEFSCCAIGTRYRRTQNTDIVGRFYVEAFSQRSHKERPLTLLNRVSNHAGWQNDDESQGFRILMLSLIKAAWRDLV